MSRRVIADLGKEAFHVEEREDGSVVLMRTTPVDDGPARSIVIPPEAMQAVASVFWVLSINRTMAQIGRAITTARSKKAGRVL